MTAPAAKPDAIQLARLTPWVDLLAPKAPAGGGPAQPVVSTPRVDNDVLLPTRADLHPQAPASGQRAPGAPVQAGVPARADSELSGVARLITGLLADSRPGEGRAVRGTAPVWTGAGRPPDARAMAASLARQLSDSGLFYESHLAQFVAGSRSLAQMQREPQALLAQPIDAPIGTPIEEPTPVQTSRAGLLPLATPPAPADAVPADPGAPGLVKRMDLSSTPTAEEPSQQPTLVLDADGASQQPEPLARTAQHAMQYESAQLMSQPVDAATLRHSNASASDAGQNVATQSQQAPVIHPQAGALVQQQLDMLAGAMFRWSGEAWPGVPMQWSVQDEGAHRQAEDESAGSAAQWSTTMAIELPRLGHVDVRLKLSGAAVRAQFASPRSETLAQLRLQDQALAQRLTHAGLALASMQVDTELAAP